MKKALIVVLILISGYLGIHLFWTNLMEQSAIPEQAIRIRILAHSNQLQDQQIKQTIKNEVLKINSLWENTPRTLEDTRALIVRHLPMMRQRIAKHLVGLGVDYDFTLKLAKVAFPEKTYDGQKVPAGNYETLLITLGSGAGDNWWCVMYPSICNEQVEVSDQSTHDSQHQTQSRFWLWELVQSWFK
jgi:stage II sporulation protein R